MCGIIGVVSLDNAPFKALAGLRKLEYRGYDSWGIAFKNCDMIESVKRVGRISMPERGSLNHNSYAAIAHTRWATHGKVSESNAHPHLSNDGSVAIVHNGIVENYSELRQKLAENNFSFKSETDSEVIANLIQFNFAETKNFKEAVKKALSELEGSYALIVLHNKSFEMIAARNGSPLVIGIGNREFFAASDTAAFLQFTKKAVYLNDNELAVIGKNLQTENIVSGEKIEPEVKEISWTPEQAQKGEYDYFMLKEINEQKETLVKAIQQDSSLVDEITKLIKNAKRVFFIGCGTSYYACLSASYLFRKVARKSVNVVLASEFSDFKNFVDSEIVVVAVSQSGETADLIDAVKIANEQRAVVVSIVNVMDSSLTRLSKKVMFMNAGPEICVLSTKSYTSQLSILTLLAYSCAGRLQEGKTLIKEASLVIPGLIDSNLASLKGLARELKDSTSIFLIGRGLTYPTAMEAALKIKEVSYIHAEAFAGGELKHGTIALIDKGVPVISFATNQTRKLIVSNAVETKSRGARIIGLDSEENEAYDSFISIPELGDVSPICMIIPMQILAYYLALERGYDVDKPRNLSKVVTVR